MTKLVLVDFKTMDRLLGLIGFEAVRQKGVMSFTVILTAEQQPYPIIPAETSPVRFCGKFSEK